MAIRSRWGIAAVALLACLLSAACLGKGLRYDAERLRKKCKLSAGAEVTRDQARCIAKVAGLKEGRKCPFVIEERSAGAAGEVFDVHESCSGIGLSIARASGEVVRVDFGEASAGHGEER